MRDSCVSVLWLPCSSTGQQNEYVLIFKGGNIVLVVNSFSFCYFFFFFIVVAMCDLVHHVVTIFHLCQLLTGG